MSNQVAQPSIGEYRFILGVLSGLSFRCFLIDQHKKKVSKFEIPQTCEGFSELEKSFEEIEKKGKSKAAVLLEPRSYWWLNLYNRYKDRVVFFEGPIIKSKEERDEKWFLEVIAQNPPLFTPKSAQRLALQEKIRDYLDINKDINTTVNRLVGILCQVFPEYLQVWDSLVLATPLAILRKWPNPVELSRLNVYVLEDFMIETAKAKTDTLKIKKRAKEILDYAKSTIGREPNATEIRIIENLIVRINQLKEIRRLVAEDIEMMAKNLPEVEGLRKVAGIGTITSAELAVWIDVNILNKKPLIKARDALTRYVGFDPKLSYGSLEPLRLSLKKTDDKERLLKILRDCARNDREFPGYTKKLMSQKLVRELKEALIEGVIKTVDDLENFIEDRRYCRVSKRGQSELRKAIFQVVKWRIMNHPPTRNAMKVMKENGIPYKKRIGRAIRWTITEICKALRDPQGYRERIQWDGVTMREVIG